MVDYNKKKSNKEIILDVIKCWKEGIMKYWDNDNKATYGEFINNTNNKERIIRNKHWESAKNVIENGKEKMDDCRSDYYDPFPIDRYTFEDLPPDEEFNWIIKGNDIWLNLIANNNIGCLKTISCIYATKDPKLHIILSNLNNILFMIYKNTIVSNIDNSYLQYLLNEITNRLDNYITINPNCIKFDYSGNGILKIIDNKYNVYINCDSNKNISSNNFENGFLTFKKIIKNNINSCTVYKVKKSKKVKK